MTENHKQLSPGSAALISAYLDGNLPKIKRAQVESLVASNEEASKIFQIKAAKRQELKTLIPNKKLSK
ncbi:MAG: hypothetical protein WEB87_04550, partial [Bacteriovoracaceae bacterium]